MAPVGTLHTIKTRVHGRSRKIFAVAALSSQELHVPDFQIGVTNKTTEYLSKFPLGKIPCFEVGDDLKIAESNAIAYYLADISPRREQLLGSSPQKCAEIQQWIFFSELQLERDIAKVGKWRLGLVPYQAEDEKSGSEGLVKWLDYLDTSIKGKRWFVEEASSGMSGPSLADLTIAGAMHFAFAAWLDEERRKRYSALMEWYERLKAVPELSKLYEGPMVERRKEVEDVV